MDARDLEGIWEAHARHDPLWAILSDPTKKNRGWEIDRFFESGEREVRFLLRALNDVDYDKGDALDFGCGVGRLTHALARSFAHVTGVDISPTMIELASALNDKPDRIRFVHNARDDLSAFAAEEFDFVYTNIVLQHIPPALSKAYLVEFLRVLRPRGVLVFQLPSHLRPADELTVRAMPDDAYRAEIRVDEWPRIVTPSTRVGLAAHITNASSHAWHPTALGQVNLGNHWIAPEGSMERQDDGRSGMPKIVRPGEEVEILLAVTTPEREGVYELELDLVHETITWFRDRGSTSCKLRIEVAADAASGVRAEDSARTTRSSKLDAWEKARSRLPELAMEPDPFPMFAVPHDEVMALLERERVDVIDVREDGHAGWDWVGYRYSLRKRG